MTINISKKLKIAIFAIIMFVSVSGVINANGVIKIINGKPTPYCEAPYEEDCGEGLRRKVGCGPNGEFRPDLCNINVKTGKKEDTSSKATCPIGTIFKNGGCAPTAKGTDDETIGGAPKAGADKSVANKPAKPNDPKTIEEANKVTAGGSGGQGGGTANTSATEECTGGKIKCWAIYTDSTPNDGFSCTQRCVTDASQCSQIATSFGTNQSATGANQPSSCSAGLVSPPSTTATACPSGKNGCWIHSGAGYEFKGCELAENACKILDENAWYDDIAPPGATQVASYLDGDSTCPGSMLCAANNMTLPLSSETGIGSGKRCNYGYATSATLPSLLYDGNEWTIQAETFDGICNNVSHIQNQSLSIPVPPSATILPGCTGSVNSCIPPSEANPANCVSASIPVHCMNLTPTPNLNLPVCPGPESGIVCSAPTSANPANCRSLSPAQGNQYCPGITPLPSVGPFGNRQDDSIASVLGVSDAKSTITYASGVYEIDGANNTKTTIYISSDNVQVKFFLDTNGNSIHDNNEVILDGQSITVKLNKKEELSEYKLINGWNLVGLDLVSDKWKSAALLMKELNSDNLSPTHISTYQNGKWSIYTQRINEAGQVVTFGEDFNILPGKAYFVKTEKSGTLSLTGQKYAASVPLDIVNGWNLLTVQSSTQYKASTFLDKCSSSGANCDSLARYDSGLYDIVVKDSGVLFGNDFNLNTKSGYFLRVKDGGGKRVTP